MVGGIGKSGRLGVFDVGKIPTEQNPPPTRPLPPARLQLKVLLQPWVALSVCFPPPRPRYRKSFEVFRRGTFPLTRRQVTVEREQN